MSADGDCMEISLLIAQLLNVLLYDDHIRGHESSQSLLCRLSIQRLTAKLAMWGTGRFARTRSYHASQHLLKDLRVGVKRARVYASAASLIAPACVG